MNEVISINYGSQSTLSRWFKNYWTEKDKQAMPWLVTLLLSIFLFQGPRLLLWLASLLPLDQLGNSGASIRAHEMLVAVAASLAISTLAIFARPLTKPKRIEVSPNGIRKVWQFGFISLAGRTLSWNDISAIQLIDFGEGTGFGRSKQIRFMATDLPKSMKLSLTDLTEDAQKELLMQAISRWAKKSLIEAGVVEELKPHREMSFTELWLEALSAAPKRDLLLPLAEGALIAARYRIIKRLGDANKGGIYLAEDSETHKEVVLKEIFLPVYTDLINRKLAAEDFQKQASVLESLAAPGIVKIIGSLIVEQRAFLIMEYVKGTTIEESLEKSGPLTVEKTIELGMRMCDILEILHGNNPQIIHQGFTPENLIWNQQGELILVGFNFLEAREDGDVVSRGRTAYMAPEQLKGMPTAQSDVYAAAATLSFCLTGQHPEPFTECHPIIVNDAVPLELDKLLANATEYDAKQRCTDVRKLRNSLAAL